MSWIDEINIENLKESAEEIIVDMQDIERTFSKLKGKTTKAPGPNLINQYIIKLAFKSHPE